MWDYNVNQSTCYKWIVAPGTTIKSGIKFWASSSILQRTYSTNESFCIKNHHKHILIWSKLQSAHATRKGMWNILIITWTLFTIGFCNQVNITKYLHLRAPFIFPFLWQTCNILIKIELNYNSNSMTVFFINLLVTSSFVFHHLGLLHPYVHKLKPFLYTRSNMNLGFFFPHNVGT